MCTLAERPQLGCRAPTAHRSFITHIELTCPEGAGAQPKQRRSRHCCEYICRREEEKEIPPRTSRRTRLFAVPLRPARRLAAARAAGVSLQRKCARQTHVRLQTQSFLCEDSYLQSTSVQVGAGYVPILQIDQANFRLTPASAAPSRVPCAGLRRGTGGR